jgi:hypothetical protein
VVLPLTKVQRDSFYVGHGSLWTSVECLLRLSLYHHPLSRRLAALFPDPGFWLLFLSRAVVPAVLAAAAVTSCLALYQWARERSFIALDRSRQFMLLGGSSMLLAIVILFAAKHVVGLLYPHGRTGLYLIPLFILTALALPGSLRSLRPASIVTGLAVWMVGLICLAQFAAQFQSSHYGEWRFDASTKKIVGLIRERQASQPLARVRVGITAIFEPSVNFYRRMYRLNWMDPVDRTGPNGDFDFYILLGDDTSLVKRRGLTVLYSDSLSGAWLAAGRGHGRISP